MTMSITKGHTRLIPCSLHSDCKNVQKSALKSVNVQRTGKSIILQMLAFSIFEGSHICRFLSILRPHRPSESLQTPKNKGICTDYQTLIFAVFTFCTRKWYRQQSMRFQPRLSINCDYRAIQNTKYTIFDAQSKMKGKTFVISDYFKTFASF